MSTSPVAVSLLTDQVFAQLREEIVNGELPVGARLTVRELAARLGTSPMPVREAILRLEQVGLADRMPHRGAVVRGVTLTELLHIYNVRLLLEVEAAREGAAAATPATTSAMGAALDRMNAAVQHGEVIDALDLDEELLRGLYTAQPNNHLVDIIENLWRRCRTFKILGAQAALRDEASDLWSYQSQLLAAASSNNPGQAADVTRQSLLSARRRIEHQLGADTPS